jgi:hypothetical protein
LLPRSKEILGRALAASFLATLVGSELAAIYATAAFSDGSILNTAQLLLLSILVAPFYAGIFVVPLGTLAAGASWPVISQFEGRRTVPTLAMLVGYGMVLGALLGLALFWSISAICDAQTHSHEFALFGGWGAFFGALSAAAWWLLIPIRKTAS